MMISEKDKIFYFQNGYLLLKEFFLVSDVDRILNDAKQLFFKQFAAKGYTSGKNYADISGKEFNDMLFRLFEEDIQVLSNCGKQVQHLISLHRLSVQERVVELLNSIGLKFPNISTRPVLFFNHPRLSKEKVFYKVDAHQDWRSMQGSLNSVVLWAPLIDINKDLGALEILPKSHTSGLMTDNMHYGFGMVKLNGKEQQDIIAVEVEKGDALLFSSFLVHQSGNNITDKPRWSCHFRYNDLAEKTFVDRGYPHPYIYKPAEELITPDFPQPSQIQTLFQNE